MPDKLTQFYDYLKANGASVAPNIESFKIVLSNESKAKQYHSYLMQEGFNAPESFDSFYSVLGFKKNESSQQGSKNTYGISTTPLFDFPKPKTPTVLTGKARQQAEKEYQDIENLNNRAAKALDVYNQAQASPMVEKPETPKFAYNNKTFNKTIKDLEQAAKLKTKDLKDFADPRLMELYDQTHGETYKDPIIKTIEATLDFAGDIVPTRVKNAWERGKIQGEIASLIPLESLPTEDELRQVAFLQQESDQYAPSKEALEFEENDASWLFTNPLKASKLVGEWITESLSAQLKASERTSAAGIGMGAAGGSIAPGIGTLAGAGMGFTAGQIAAGMNLETSGKILEVLNEAGFNTKDGDELVKAFHNKDLMDKARSLAIKRGIPIAIFDLASGGIAGKILTKPAKSALGKVGRTLGEAGVQATLGATGEFTGQLSAGEDINGKAILQEAFGEIGGSVHEVAGAAMTYNKPKKRALTSSSNENIATQIANDAETGVVEAKQNLDQQLADGRISEQEHKEGLEFVEKAKAVVTKIPDKVTGENKAKSVTLLTEKEAIKAEIESLEAQKSEIDEVYHDSIDSEIASLESSLARIHSDLKAISEVAPNTDHAVRQEDNQVNQYNAENTDRKNAIAPEQEGTAVGESSSDQNFRTEEGASQKDFNQGDNTNAKRLSPQTEQDTVLETERRVILEDQNGSLSVGNKVVEDTDELSDLEIEELKPRYHYEQRTKAEEAIRSIVSSWQNVSINNNPEQKAREFIDLNTAVARFAYHSVMDGSIKLKGKLATKIEEVLNKLGISNLADNEYSELAKTISAQFENAKSEISKYRVKRTTESSTRSQSDFKVKDSISRLSQMKQRIADEMRGYRKGFKEGVKQNDESRKQQFLEYDSFHKDSRRQEIDELKGKYELARVEYSQKKDEANRQQLLNAKKQYEERIANQSLKNKAKEDIVTGLKSEILEQIKKAKNDGSFDSEVKAHVFERAVKKLNSAKTPMQLLSLVEYLDKVFADTHYDSKVKKAEELKARLKKTLINRILPSNIRDGIKNIVRHSPGDLSDIEAYNDLLSAILANVKGNDASGINVSELDYLANHLAKEQENKALSRYKLLLGDRAAAQVKTLEEMKDEIRELSAPEYEIKDNRRDADEAVAEILNEDLTNADLSHLIHPEEVAALKALREVNIAKLTDKELRIYNLAVNNLLINGKLNGVGAIIAAYRMHESFLDTDKIAEIKKMSRAVGSMATAFSSNWATIPTQLKRIINSDRGLAKYWVITGLSDVKNKYSRVMSKMTELEKGINSILKENKALRDSPKRQLLVSVYADLAQFEQGSTSEQIHAEFKGRKEAVQETIKRLTAKSTTDKKFAKQHKRYIETLEEVYSEIKPANSIEGIKLDPDQKKLYNYMRGFFESIQEDTRLNAEIYNNINFKPVENYFPRTYNKVDDIFGVNSEKQMENQLLGDSVFYNKEDIKAEDSGSKQSRSLKKGVLPVNKVMNLDLVSNFMNTARNVLYDIETQPHRLYSAKVLSSENLREVMADDSAIEVTRSVANQLVRNQRLSILPKHTKTIQRALWEFYRSSANRFALGGSTQVFKQYLTTITATTVALGKNTATLPHSIVQFIHQNEKANELLSHFPISRRGEEKSALTHVVIKESDISKLTSSLNKSAIRLLDRWSDIADGVTLSPLIYGDLTSAKVSWLAFYKDFMLKEGKIASLEEFNLENEAANPNKEAAEYAEQMTNSMLNVNDRTLQPVKNLGALFPFSSFAINSTLNMVEDISRATRTENSIEERTRAGRMVLGNMLSKVVLNKISQYIRAGMIIQAGTVITGMITKDQDLGDEEEKLLLDYLEVIIGDTLDANDKNSTDYLIKDIVFGSLLTQFTDPIYDSFKEVITGEKEFARPRDFLDMIGTFGIPAKTVVALYNKYNDINLTDEQFRQQRYGIESADGSMLYVPKENRDEKRPDFSRKAMKLAFTMNAFQVLTTASSQELGAIGRRIPQIIKKLEDKKYGVKRKFDPETYEKAFSVISFGKEKYQLDANQLEYRRKMKGQFLKSYYDQVKSTPVVSDKQKEVAIREAANEYSKAQVILKYKGSLTPAD